METPKFQKNVENFNCEHCGQVVTGNGFTNHCPTCLWSQHVDVNPGDRAATCRGMMEPTSVNLEKGEYILTHTCKNCGYQKKNKVAEDDDFDVVVSIATKVAENEEQQPITGSVTRAPLGAGQQMIGSFSLGQ